MKLHFLLAPAIGLWLFLLVTSGISFAADQRYIPSGKGVTLEGLIMSSDLIVVGEIVDLERNFPFYGYNDDGSLADNPVPSRDTMAFPALDYNVRVEEVLYDPRISTPEAV